MAHVPSGMLRHSMTVQNPVRTVDAYGQGAEAWVNVGTLRCHAEQMRTGDVVDDLGPAIRTDWRIIANWHPDVSTRSRLLWDDGTTTRTFNLRACWDRDSRRRRLEIEATEVLP
jgi:head-tail adaptor